MSGPIVLVLRFFLAISLYAFLGWVLLTLWLELKQQSSLLTAKKIPTLTLEIQDEGKVKQVLHFPQVQVTIGRHPACECRLKEDQVSSRHARLMYHHGQWWLEDLDSTNGTYLNNERLLTPTVVITGDTFKCGETLLNIRVSGTDTEITSKEILDEKNR